MILPAYVLQLLTNATGSALPVSWQQASAIRLADGLRGFYGVNAQADAQVRRRGAASS